MLVFGGSQGAHAINEAMIRCLPVLRREAPGIHIIHQTGERDYNDALAAYKSLGESAEVFKFIEDMPAAFARADLVVCRSGASTVAEIAAAGKPAVFVPFPARSGRSSARQCRSLGEARRRSGGRRVKAGRSLAGGNDCRVAAGLPATAKNEPGRAGVGASECRPRHRGDGSAGGGNGRTLATDSHGSSRIILYGVLALLIRVDPRKSVAKKLTLCSPKFSASIS